MIFKQLKSSGVEAFYDLMQIGFPSKVEISVLFRGMKSFLTSRQISLGEKVCCRILFLAFGFTTKEFKFGKSEIFIRPGKAKFLDKLHADLKYSEKEMQSKFKSGYLNFMRNIMNIRLRFLGKSEYLSRFLKLH